MDGAVLASVFNAVAPVVVVALIGYVWRRSGAAVEPKSLTPIATEVGVPCLVFSALAKVDVPFAKLGVTALATILVFTLAGLLAWAFLRVVRLDRRTFVPPLMFPNAGNLALPLALTAFGEEGLSYALVFFTIATISNQTIGRSIMAGEGRMLQTLKAPIVPAIVLGLACSGFNLAPPAWLMTATSLVGNLAMPIMLIALGAALATIRIGSLGRSFWLSLVRLLGGAAIGFAVAAAFGLEGIQRGVLVLSAAMPSAVVNYAFAQVLRSDDAHEVAGIVAVSTLLSVITTPILLGILLHS